MFTLHTYAPPPLRESLQSWMNEFCSFISLQHLPATSSWNISPEHLPVTSPWNISLEQLLVTSLWNISLEHHPGTSPWNMTLEPISEASKGVEWLVPCYTILLDHFTTLIDLSKGNSNYKLNTRQLLKYMSNRSNERATQSFLVLYQFICDALCFACCVVLCCAVPCTVSRYIATVTSFQKVRLEGTEGMEGMGALSASVRSSR